MYVSNSIVHVHVWTSLISNSNSSISILCIISIDTISVLLLAVRGVSAV